MLKERRRKQKEKEKTREATLNPTLVLDHAPALREQTASEPESPLHLNVVNRSTRSHTISFSDVRRRSVGALFFPAYPQLPHKTSTNAPGTSNTSSTAATSSILISSPNSARTKGSPNRFTAMFHYGFSANTSDMPTSPRSPNFHQDPPLIKTQDSTEELDFYEFIKQSAAKTNRQLSGSSEEDLLSHQQETPSVFDSGSKAEEAKVLPANYNTSDYSNASSKDTPGRSKERLRSGSLSLGLSFEWNSRDKYEKKKNKANVKKPSKRGSFTQKLFALSKLGTLLPYSWLSYWKALQT